MAEFREGFLEHLKFETRQAKSVFLASPIYRHPTRQFALAMIKTVALLQRLGVNSQVEWNCDCPFLPLVRNELVAEFLASDCTDLFFLDDDIRWKPEDLIRLLDHEEDYIGGVGRKKDMALSITNPGAWCCSFKEGCIPDQRGVVEVDNIGTGFLKLNRKVFEKIIAVHPNLKMPGPSIALSSEAQDNFYTFFKAKGELILAEDYMFGELWKKVGGKIYADTEIELGHVGERIFEGSIAHMF